MAGLALLCEAVGPGGSGLSGDHALPISFRFVLALCCRWFVSSYPHGLIETGMDAYRPLRHHH